MTLTREQLNAIVARAFPGDRLREVRELAGDRHTLILAGGDRLELHTYASSDAAATAVAALRLLRGEVDLPLPVLRAADVEGSTIGQPYVLLAEVHGEPLSQVLPRLTDEQLYDIGRRLGAVVYRIHRIARDRYGRLTEHDPNAAADERSYALSRLRRDLASCEELGLLNQQVSAEIRAWFEHAFTPVGRQAALLHGRLTPETILVRQIQGRWTVGGLIGWDRALGWAPAWEHVTFLTAVEGLRFFGLRVGYGNGYDENTERPYEQVREYAMAPYRIVLLAQRLWESGSDGAVAASEHYRAELVNLLRWLTRSTHDTEPTVGDMLHDES